MSSIILFLMDMMHSDHTAKKLCKVREKLISSSDPEERTYLQKRLKKLERAANAPAPTSSLIIPKEAFRIRHKWVK